MTVYILFFDKRAAQSRTELTDLYTFLVELLDCPVKPNLVKQRFKFKKNHAVATKPFRQNRRILLKNSSLIGCALADSIPVLIGGFGDDGTEAGSTGGVVL